MSRRPVSAEEHERRLTVLREERRKSYSTLESVSKAHKRAARRLGVSTSVLGQYVDQLRQEGEPIHWMPKERIGIHNPERRKILRKSLEYDWTLDETGKALGGVTRERARQLRVKYVRVYGAPESKVRRVSLREIGQQHPDWSKSVIRRVVRGISCDRLTTQQLERVEAGVEKAYRPRECSYCGEEFAPSGETSRKGGKRAYFRTKFCCDEHAAAANNSYERRHRPISETGTGKYSQIKRSLVPVDNPVWVTHSEGCKQTGLSHMQVAFLGNRQAVRTRKSRTRKWRGRPQLEYLLNDLFLAKQVLGK